MLELKSVNHGYKKQIIFRDLNTRFAKGVTVITGPSGAGKSTLLRLCASAERAKSGAISWQGHNIRKSSSGFRKVLGYAPQIIDFPEDISAQDFLFHIGALKSLSRDQIVTQSLEILTRLNLDQDAQKLIRNYSGGMRRRLGLAQAFLGEPECLILDEPTAELDPITAGIVNDLIFSKSEQSVVLMTTHLADHLSGYEYREFKVEGLAG